MDITEKQLPEFIKQWAQQYGTPQECKDLFGIIDNIEKRGETLNRFPYKDAAEIFEKSSRPYEDLKTLMNIKGQSAVFRELKTLVHIYNEHFDNLMDQADIIEGRIDDIYGFTDVLDKSVRDEFVEYLGADTARAEGEGEDVDLSEYQPSDIKYCKSFGTNKEKCGCECGEDEITINYDFDFSALGKLIKDLIDRKSKTVKNN